MPTYLSLDLDFFNAAGKGVEPTFCNLVENRLEAVGRFIRRHNIPATAVMNHQQMLRFVNESGCDTLLNVDSHSDLAERNVDEFNCGTWVTFVDWRSKGRFVWHHGFATYYGDCSGDANLFGEKQTPKYRSKTSGWKAVEHVRSEVMPALTRDITHIGVCLSPSYVDFVDLSYDMMMSWCRKYDVPYVRGRRDEHFSVLRKPKIDRHEEEV